MPNYPSECCWCLCLRVASPTTTATSAPPPRLAFDAPAARSPAPASPWRARLPWPHVQPCWLATSKFRCECGDTLRQPLTTQLAYFRLAILASRSAWVLGGRLIPSAPRTSLLATPMSFLGRIALGIEAGEGGKEEMVNACGTHQLMNWNW